MTDVPKFNGVPATAPMFKKTPPETLHRIVTLILDASEGFACDSLDTGEWWTADKALLEAAKLINDNLLGYAGILALYSHKNQLVTWDHLLGVVLKDARTRGPFEGRE